MSISGLAPFLAEKPGVESGLMIPQYVAAALCNENKVLVYPSSADNIPTSANQEDHNSMGATSTRKMREIISNVKGIVAIEMLVSYRGMEMYGVSGKHLSTAYSILNDTLGDFRGDIPVPCFHCTGRQPHIAESLTLIQLQAFPLGTGPVLKETCRAF